MARHRAARATGREDGTGPHSTYGVHLTDRMAGWSGLHQTHALPPGRDLARAHPHDPTHCP